MDKVFDFKTTEQKINEKWLSGNYFRANLNKDKKPYTIIMPPPNITARLHIGHALTLTIQDIIIRFKRMQGFEALYLPGADHAALATEVKVVEELKKQGIEKSSLTREQFMQHVEVWYKTYTDQIVDQMKRLGLSCDWSRFSFTMDERTTKAVKTAFNRLHEKGLIYRGERMINWCPGCKTSLSDAEVEYLTENRHIWEVKYSTANGSGCISVATVRPETIYGDVAVAVNPKDKRYTKLVGTYVVNPLTDEKIPVIADDAIDIKFGTGALKVTPAHDQLDYEISQRHSLKVIRVEDLSPEARIKVVEILKQKGSFVSQKNYKGNVAKCHRCFTAIEPTISNQWFIAMKELAKPAIESLNNGLTVVPKKFEKIYLHWLNNIQDWCISRQLISGHRVPIDGETDVLDTWFSSALWPFCTLGWPDNTPDFQYFYPTQTLVTAYEIIFFWVIRMVFSGIEYTGELPFNTVLFHGLVRDNQGRKMSKSLGNGIDPVKVIDDFGTDALRFSIISGMKLDRDPRYGMEKATLARNFINKIWNATKFYLHMPVIKDETLRDADKWILAKLNTLIKSVTKKYEKFELGVAANELQIFFWNNFCDWYIEESKTTRNREVFGHVLVTFLKLMNPIMPFVTEHIYCTELGLGDTLAFEPFPIEDKKTIFTREAKEFDAILLKIKLERAEKAAAENVQKQIVMLKKEVERAEKLLSNSGFIAKAPKNVIAEEREKLATNKKLMLDLASES